jgi:FixJ family two-component response regulator
MPRTPLISIVDDDEALRRSLENLIRSAGFHARGYSSAETLLKSTQLAETDCLVLDVRIPGMSGLEVQSELNAGKFRVPIIFITAYESGDQRKRALEAGAVAFLNKPFDEEDLLNAIDAALKNT